MFKLKNLLLLSCLMYSINTIAMNQNTKTVDALQEYSSAIKTLYLQELTNNNNYDFQTVSLKRITNNHGFTTDVSDITNHEGKIVKLISNISITDSTIIFFMIIINLKDQTFEVTNDNVMVMPAKEDKQKILSTMRQS